MGYKTKTIVAHTKIERNKVYIVYKSQRKPYSGEKEIVRCFTTLKKAKEWINKFIEDMKEENMVDEVIEERTGSIFKGTKQQYFTDYHYHDFPGSACYYILRIVAHELDADYDEECWVTYNPKEES